MKERSDGRCEQHYWTEVVNYSSRCLNRATDIHHRLPRSRGGRLLDDWGESLHLMHLCHECHMEVHRNPTKAYQNGSTISGYVLKGSEGRPVYTGDNRVLSLLYPKPKEHDEGHIRHRQTHQLRRVVGDPEVREVDQDEECG